MAQTQRMPTNGGLSDIVVNGVVVSGGIASMSQEMRHNTGTLAVSLPRDGSSNQSFCNCL